VESEKKVIEIRGTKFEVDLRRATIIEELRVGDTIAVLKRDYGEKYTVHDGVVVGFEPFQTLPTVVLAHLASGYEGGDIKILAYNEKTKDVEIVKKVDDILFDKEEALRLLDGKIETARQSLRSAEKRKAYFLRHFARYWRSATEVEQTRQSVLGEDA
jgi:hypothetical protein